MAALERATTTTGREQRQREADLAADRAAAAADELGRLTAGGFGNLAALSLPRRRDEPEPYVNVGANRWWEGRRRWRSYTSERTREDRESIDTEVRGGAIM